MSILQRVVSPSPDNLEALPLYISSPWLRTAPWSPEHSWPPVAAQGDEWPVTLAAGSLVQIKPGLDVSFATYLNAFPAAYWRASTTVEEITLELELTGRGVVSVYRSDETGQRIGVAYRTVPEDGRVELDIPLGDCADGGWIWFDLQAGEEPLALVSGQWTTRAEPARSGLTSIGITTHNKPSWCVASLGQLADAPELLELLSQVVVVDQGTDLLENAEGFDDVAARLGEKLRVVRQGNLGGSGGFSRGMIEAVHREGTENVLLLDDDVRLEPEGIRRAITFSRYTPQPVIVGGQMCDLHRPAVLHAFSEWVNPDTFWWEPTPGTERTHDFGQTSLLETPWLHARAKGGFNGWWMCLIPVPVLEQIGYSLPLFLKWDDAEYGLRAAEAGVPTVSLPGSSIWHVAWVDKDDAIDWQSYFHVRNRLVAALLHGRRGIGGTLAALEFRSLLRRSLSMQYGTTAVRLRALREVLAGPQTLHAGIGTIVGDLRAEAATHPDMVRRAPEDVPRPDVEGVTMGTDVLDGEPRGLGLIVFAARTFARAILTPVSRRPDQAPQASFAHRYGEWWRTPRFDSVLVPTADDKAYFWLRRDRRTLVKQILESARLTAALRRRWPELQDQYRSAQDELTSEAAWRRTIGL